MTLKKTQGKPLNVRIHCHLLIPASSLGAFSGPLDTDTMPNVATRMNLE
jgi:hypothetical protein